MPSIKKLNDPKDKEAAFNLAMLELATASEIQQQSARELRHRDALGALARAHRQQALHWYRIAVANGTPRDLQLEAILVK